MSGNFEKNHRKRTHDKRSLIDIQANYITNATFDKLQRKMSADLRKEM
jgi:hypothetical protein